MIPRLVPKINYQPEDRGMVMVLLGSQSRRKGGGRGGGRGGEEWSNQAYLTYRENITYKYVCTYTNMTACFWRVGNYLNANAPGIPIRIQSYLSPLFGYFQKEKQVLMKQGLRTTKLRGEKA